MTTLLTLASMALVAVLDAWGRTRRDPKPAPPRRNYDVLAPAPRSQATRPVPPVADPPDASGPHYQQVAGIWGPDVLEIPHTVREYPFVDWQARIQERRN